MYNFLASFTLFNPGSVVAPLLFLVTGGIMIALDLRNRKLGMQRVAWYQRFWIVLGIIQIIAGSIVLIFSHLLPFSIPQTLSSTILLLFLMIVSILGIYACVLLIRTVLKLSKQHQAIRLGNIEASEVASITANPLLLYMRILLLVETCFLPIVFLSAFSPLYELIIEHQQSFYGWIRLLAVPFLEFFLYRTYICFHYLHRLEHLRFTQAARRSNDTMLAPTEPTPSKSIMITERLKRTHISLFALLVLLLVVPGTLPMIFSPSFRIFPFLFLPFLIFGLIALVISFLPFFIVRHTINATENGLRNGFGGFVSWQEASLFACYKLPSLLGSYPTTIIYELSSPRRVVRWHWIRSPRSLLTMWETQLPPDIYHQRLQALCELVTAKTGLELHNLSQLIEEK